MSKSNHRGVLDFARTIFATIVISVTLTTAVYAASSVSIRLEQPKSPTNGATFDINFVTLDTGGNPITVKCFKKGPPDGDFVQFGADISLAAGGNGGNCSVTGSILTGDGTYQFQATANNGSETATSNTVAIVYNTSGPDTPTNYSKEQVSSCIWRIKFKTANDGGKTVKVEVYRSDATSFNADGGTRVATVSIGSNTDGSADVTSPDCSKTYYFAVRAFDNAGNGSGVVGDSVTNVTTISPTPSPGAAVGAIPVSGAGGQVLGQKAQGEQAVGKVEGEATAQAQNPSPVVQATSSELGKPGIFRGRNIVIGLVVLVGLGLGFFLLLLLRRNKNNA